MSVFRKAQNQVHSMQGNHIAGVATPASGARQVEMWHGRMDANSATPPHSHSTEEVVLFLKGSGKAMVGEREVRYEQGDTLILPPAQVHQIFAETESEFVAAMPIGGTVCFQPAMVDGTPVAIAFTVKIDFEVNQKSTTLSPGSIDDIPRYLEELHASPGGTTELVLGFGVAKEILQVRYSENWLHVEMNFCSQDPEGRQAAVQKVHHGRCLHGRSGVVRLDCRAG
jgi:quercetin dioxygenase-like cupin family protein